MPNQDALVLIHEDQEAVDKLLEKLVHTTERALKTRRTLADQLLKHLRMQIQVEEEIVYPAFRDAALTKGHERLYYEAKEEHHAIDKTLADLLRADPGTSAFGGKAKVLQELVKHHAGEQQRVMFPAMRELLNKDERIELGQRVLDRKHEIENGRAWDMHAATS
jgi:hypothetical protein